MRACLVQFYLPRLSDGDLVWLMTWPGVAVRKPGRVTLVGFAKWLLGVVTAELDRRRSTDLIETELPWLPLDQWTPQQVGHALLALFAMSRETDSQPIGEFADAILDVVVAANFAHTLPKDEKNETARLPNPT